MCYFGTVNQRPRYWLIQIDSKEDITSDDWDVEGIIIQALVEEFGEYEDWIQEDEFKPDDNFDTYQEYQEHNSYPRLHLDGYHWGVVVNMVTGETE